MCVLFVNVCALCAISVSLLCGFIIWLDGIVYPEETQVQTCACTHTHKITVLVSNEHTNAYSQVCVYPLVCMSRTITGRKKTCLATPLYEGKTHKCKQHMSLSFNRHAHLEITFTLSKRRHTNEHTISSLRRDLFNKRKPTWPLLKDRACRHKPACGLWVRKDHSTECEERDERRARWLPRSTQNDVKRQIRGT